MSEALLDDGRQVWILDDLSTGRPENVPAAVKIHVCGIAGPATVDDAIEGADGCFHLATIASVQLSNEEWALTHRVNLTNSIEVFDAARSALPGGNPIPVV